MFHHFESLREHFEDIFAKSYAFSSKQQPCNQRTQEHLIVPPMCLLILSLYCFNNSISYILKTCIGLYSPLGCEDGSCDDSPVGLPLGSPLGCPLGFP